MQGSKRKDGRFLTRSPSLFSLVDGYWQLMVIFIPDTKLPLHSAHVLQIMQRLASDEQSHGRQIVGGLAGNRHNSSRVIEQAVVDTAQHFPYNITTNVAEHLAAAIIQFVQEQFNETF